MNKSEFCQNLFDDIKDDIEFDSDVVALYSLLLTMLKFDIEESLENWKYLILKNDLNDKKNEIDFKPIIKDYPEKLFSEMGVQKFFDYMDNIPSNKAKIIYDNIMDVYNSDCFIYGSLRYYIEKNDDQEERNIIRNILDKSNDFSKIIFDKTELIRRIICIHIDSKKIPLDLIKDLINNVENKKERAVLKTLIIDYL